MEWEWLQMFIQMPIHDKVNGRSVHLDIHGCQYGERSWYGWHCSSSEWQRACIASRTRGEQHLSKAGNSFCAWCQLDMPVYTRKWFLLYVSYALKLGVWLSFVSFTIHRSWKMSLISIIAMHIAEQCLSVIVHEGLSWNMLL